MRAFFVSDLHGDEEKYDKLFDLILKETPDSVFIGGDVFPVYYAFPPDQFMESFLTPRLEKLKLTLQSNYPGIYIITGNDDPAFTVPLLEKMDKNGLIFFSNNRKLTKGSYTVFGYPYVPPTPFMLKDFEKYDISRFIPRGSVSPEEGFRTVSIEANKIKWSTIKYDLNDLTYGFESFDKCLMLFHSPPYDTNLDKMIGQDIDGIDELTNVGSIAIRKFIELNQPLLTMHGHIHESPALSGSWRDMIGNTTCFSAACEANELAVIKFDTNDLQQASRILI